METNEKNIKQYKKIVKENKPKPKKSHLIMSFLVGGFICIIGQIINDFFSMKGFSITEASNMTSIVLVFIGSFLTGIGVYDNIGKKAGAGSIVPITGFANSVVSCAMEYSKEGYIFGMAANMFKIAGPVIVFGITSSSIVGLIYFILTR
ncbi:stage V sporulation protein AC [Anaerofustis butyriciformans]|uniref:stage V sporulation protein AC n=1 Tax=Anaerofustis butyriciformans TaxID=3108533 RepID=UPI002E3311BB|nr:stage V sporulation protein AC [Anaerofustis sp. HA2171]